MFGRFAPAQASVSFGSSYNGETLLRVEPQPEGKVDFPELQYPKVTPGGNGNHAAASCPVLGMYFSSDGLSPCH